MYELKSGFVAVAEGCTEINNDTDLSHTVIGVFFTAEEAKLACELRAGHLKNFITKGCWSWHRGIWTAGTESGETMYGVTKIGEDES